MQARKSFLAEEKDATGAAIRWPRGGDKNVVFVQWWRGRDLLFRKTVGGRKAGKRLFQK